MDSFTQFTELYSLSKTLRFELTDSKNYIINRKHLNFVQNNKIRI